MCRSFEANVLILGSKFGFVKSYPQFISNYGRLDNNLLKVLVATLGEKIPISIIKKTSRNVNDQ